MTFAQTRSSDPTTSVWVSASAGTGKTKVLVDRLIRILYQGTPINHIVCLTFTKAAALEMRERLLARLRIDSAAHDIAATLYESLLESPESLKVMTLHAYCQGLLQKFPFEAGVLPFFDVLDDDQAYQLLMRALNNVLQSPPTEAIADAIEGVSQWMGEYVFERCLVDAFSKWHKVRHLERTYPNPTDYRAALEHAFPADFSGDTLLESTAPFIDIAETVRLLRASPQTMDQTLGEALLTDRTATGLAPHLFLTKDGSPRKKIVSADFKKKNPSASMALEDFANYIHTRQQRQNYEGWLDANSHFWHIVQAVLDVFQTLKTDQGLLDYHDLILHSLALFSDDLSLSFVHQRLDYTIDHILVDEAQDNSPEQWLFILKLVDLFIRDDTPHRSFFVVGDMKQSIYGFQGAVPHLFETLAGTFESILTSRGHTFMRLTLDDSFRTTPEILHIVDTIFSANQSANHVAGIGTYINHKPHRTDQGWVGAVLRSKDDLKHNTHDYDRDHDDAKETLEWKVFDRYESELSNDQILASDVAEHIQKILTEGWTLPSLAQKHTFESNQPRPIEPRDILILQRNRGALAGDIIRALKQRNIAVEGPDRIHLATRQCIQDIMAIMRFLCLPEDDMALAHILKSPFANDGKGFDEETLFNVCHADIYHCRSDSLWRVLCEQEANPTIDQELDLRTIDPIYCALISLTQSLKTWLSLVDYERPSFLLKSIITPALSAFENRLGADVHLLFDTFLDTVMDLEVKASTLSEVLFQLEQSMPIIKRDPTTPTGVRLMTVHGSKGLEAPFVILVDRDERLDLAKENLLWAKIDDASTGEVVDIFCLKPKATMTIEAMQALRDNALIAKKEENNRLLYVALTRPRDALLVIGGGEWTRIVHHARQSTHSESVPPFFHGAIPGSKEHQHEQADAMLPPWIDERYVDGEKSTAARTLSDPLPDQQTKAMQRGIGIHYLIEMLIKTPKDRWDILFEKAKEYDLTENDIRTVYDMVISSDFSFLFGQSACNTWTEMEVMHNGKLYRIDRIVEMEDAFWILDFKTGKRCVTSAYVQQLTVYRDLVSQMIPPCDNKKDIRLFLVWTDALMLEEIRL